MPGFFGAVHSRVVCYLTGKRPRKALKTKKPGFRA